MSSQWCFKSSSSSFFTSYNRLRTFPLDNQRTSAYNSKCSCTDPISSHKIVNNLELKALLLMEFTIFTDSIRTLLSCTDSFFTAKYSRWIMQWINTNSDVTSLILGRYFMRTGCWKTLIYSIIYSILFKLFYNHLFHSFPWIFQQNTTCEIVGHFICDMIWPCHPFITLFYKYFKWFIYTDI